MPKEKTYILNGAKEWDTFKESYYKKIINNIKYLTNLKNSTHFTKTRLIYPIKALYWDCIAYTTTSAINIIIRNTYSTIPTY